MKEEIVAPKEGFSELSASAISERFERISKVSSFN